MAEDFRGDDDDEAVAVCGSTDTSGQCQCGTLQASPDAAARFHHEHVLAPRLQFIGRGQTGHASPHHQDAMFASTSSWRRRRRVGNAGSTVWWQLCGDSEWWRFETRQCGGIGSNNAKLDNAVAVIAAIGAKVDVEFCCCSSCGQCTAVTVALFCRSSSDTVTLHDKALVSWRDNLSP
jgi:hypothetical protein